MSRKDLENVIRQRLYNASPELTRELASRMISSGFFQSWMDRIERKRPRGIVAWVRRLRGKDRGITPEQAKELEELTRSVLERFGR